MQPRFGPVPLDLKRAFRKWTSDEDERLRETVQKFGDSNWKQIAEGVPSRTDVQCFQRWKMVLRPGLHKGTWNQAEDDLLIFLLSKGFKDWSKLAKHLPGRTGKSCRERWMHRHDIG